MWALQLRQDTDASPAAAAPSIQAAAAVAHPGDSSHTAEERNSPADNWWCNIVQDYVAARTSVAHTCWDVRASFATQILSAPTGYGDDRLKLAQQQAR